MYSDRMKKPCRWLIRGLPPMMDHTLKEKLPVPHQGFGVLVDGRVDRLNLSRTRLIPQDGIAILASSLP